MVFSSCTPQRQSSFAINLRLVNHHQPAVSMADQLNALPDPLAPAGAQQVAEMAQILPQELEPIAEPAAVPAAPVEVALFLFLLRFLLSPVSVLSSVAQFLYGFWCCFGARYKHSVSTCRLLSTLC